MRDRAGSAVKPAARFKNPWVIAGAEKLAPAANDPPPARTSRRLMAALSSRELGSASGTRFCWPAFRLGLSTLAPSVRCSKQALLSSHQNRKRYGTKWRAVRQMCTAEILRPGRRLAQGQQR